MKAKVVKEECIACGNCYYEVPEVFEADDEGLAHVKKDIIIDESLEEKVNAAIEACPTAAIKDVTNEEEEK